MWLLADDAALALRAGEGLSSTPEQRANFMTRADASEHGTPRNLRVAGSIAEIRVEGVLTPRPDFTLWLLGIGNTTYRDIQRALASAAAEPRVKSAVLYIDSPGGTVAGLFETLAAIESFSKPIRVLSSLACSAAYAIAAVAGQIEATHAAATFGSVGVVVDYVFSKNNEHISVTNSASPDKRPDPHTVEGRKVIQRQLDALNDLFVDAIARGRGVSSSAVTTTFGRGATLLAGEAIQLRMIDRIAGNKPASRSAEGARNENRIMDAKTLKTSHPEASAALVAEGVAQERDRVSAHIKMGTKSGALPIALKAVLEGKEMTQSLMADYMSASMNRRDQIFRQLDDEAVGAAVDQATGDGESDEAHGGNGTTTIPWVMAQNGKVRAHYD